MILFTELIFFFFYFIIVFKRNFISNVFSRVLLRKILSAGITNDSCLELRLYDAIYRLRFYSDSLIHILSLSN